MVGYCLGKVSDTGKLEKEVKRLEFLYNECEHRVKIQDNTLNYYRHKEYNKCAEIVKAGGDRVKLVEKYKRCMSEVK